MKMKTYSIDYTLISEAESNLYSAGRLLVNDCEDAAAVRIAEARKLLLEFLNGDNMIEDNDTADGMVKQLETFDDIQLNLIRKLFSELIVITDYNDIRNKSLDIVNVCQKQLGEDKFENPEQLIRVMFFK